LFDPIYVDSAAAVLPARFAEIRQVTRDNALDLLGAPITAAASDFN
jgi:hypothetical protein